MVYERRGRKLEMKLYDVLENLFLLLLYARALLIDCFITLTVPYRIPV